MKFLDKDDYSFVDKRNYSWILPGFIAFHIKQDLIY